MKWMSLLRIGAASIGALGIVLVSACDQTVEPLSNSNSDPEAVAEFSPPNTGATTGPWARCTVGPDDDGIPQVCPDPASKGCDGFAASNVGLRDGNEVCVLATSCTYHCDTDSDCPSASSGSSQPTCRANTCYLPCSDTSECPNGMICYDDGYVENGVAAECQWTYACPPSVTD